MYVCNDITLCYCIMLLYYVITLCYYITLLHYVITLCYYIMLLHYAIILCYYITLLHYVITLCYYIMLLYYVIVLFTKTKSKTESTNPTSLSLSPMCFWRSLSSFSSCAIFLSRMWVCSFEDELSLLFWTTTTDESIIVESSRITIHKLLELARNLMSIKEITATVTITIMRNNN